MDPGALDNAPLGRLVALAGHVTSQHWARYLAEEHGLTVAGMTTLFTLHHHGELPHRSVAEHCYVRPATLTGVVDTLERDGLVERRRDETDRRSVRLALTPAGAELAGTVRRLIHANRPLTSVDADPAKAAVIREFLIELITTMSDGEDGRLNQHHPHHTDDPGGPSC